MSNIPLRGQIYRADVEFNPWPWLIVSSDDINRKSNSRVVVRIADIVSPPLSVAHIPLRADDPLTGYVDIEYMETLLCIHLGECLGTLTSATMAVADARLASVLGLVGR